MSDVKVVAFKSDIDELGNTIKKRSKADYDLVFPDDFVTEIEKIQDYLEDYLNGELQEYSSDEKYLPEYLFYYCDSIEEVDLPKAVSIGECSFTYCSNLRKVNLPKIKTLPQYAFRNCENLQEINIPLVTELPYYCFYNCINFPGLDLTNIKVLGSYCFYGCQGITSVDLSNISSIGDYVFQNCNNLQEVIYPSELTTVSYYLFAGCTSLQNFDFSNIITINSSAFSRCPLTEVNLPKITRLSNYCFNGCSNLVKVVIRQNTSVCTLSSTNVFGSTPIANGEGFIYVPDELLEDYKVATNWSTYAEQIKPLSEYVEEEVQQ